MGKREDGHRLLDPKWPTEQVFINRLIAIVVAVIALCVSYTVLSPGRFLAVAQAAGDGCAGNNAGLKLPPGFCATVFADDLGHPRHMVAAPDGVLYVNTWSGSYFGNSPTPPGGFLVALQDTKGSGTADVIKRFGDTAAKGGHGGTGIGLYKGAVYAEINDRIDRYALTSGSIVPTGPSP